MQRTEFDSPATKIWILAALTLFTFACSAVSETDESGNADIAVATEAPERSAQTEPTADSIPDAEPTSRPPPVATVAPTPEPTTAPTATATPAPTATPEPADWPSLPFRAPHQRNPGFGGEGWTVSIDEVRAMPVRSGEDGVCLAVIGTATLDSLDEGLTSSGFSFPEVVLIQDGIELESFSFSCSDDGLEAQGLIRIVGAEITQGTTIQWFRIFKGNSENYDIVAIENTIYTADGADVPVKAATDRADPQGRADDGPYSFGEAHERRPGFGGEGWTVSIDEVRALPIDAGEEGTCLAVIGTATLDSLDEGLTSSGFSFPEVVLIQDGIELESFSFSCSDDGLEAQGLIRIVGAEITQGTTIQWFRIFKGNSENYDIVAIENTIYEQP